MRTSTALTSYPSASSAAAASSSLPFVTAAQITSHWSSRFLEHQQLPPIPPQPTLQHHNSSGSNSSSTPHSFLAPYHASSAAYPSIASSTHSASHSTIHSRSPSFLPALHQPHPLNVRRKQNFNVDEELSNESDSELSFTDLAVLTQQVSAVRQQRRQRGLSSSKQQQQQRDDSSSIEQSNSDSGRRAGERWRTGSVAPVSEQRESATEMEHEEDDEAGSEALDGDEADDELTSPSVERADELELSVCQKTRPLHSPTLEETKTNDVDDDVAYHPATARVQLVEQVTVGW